MPDRIQIKGLEQTKRKLEQTTSDLGGRPLVNAYQRATLLIAREAKINAPVDTGRLRSSITTQVENVRGNRIRGIVGTNVIYAPYMEFGTGTFAGNKPHYVPARYLEHWARRHKTNAYAVARAISLRGGLKPRRYFQRAFDKRKDEAIEIIKKEVTKIVKK